jgi:hypothetical protein
MAINFTDSQKFKPIKHEPLALSPEAVRQSEWMATEACRDHGYEFLALVEDISGAKPIAGFTYIEPGGDRTAPLWVSFAKAVHKKWNGSPEGYEVAP